jgi:phosphoglycolate phosphatase
MKTIVFDLDGTLVNTIKDIGSSMNLALRYYGLEEHQLDEYIGFVGKGVIHLTSCAIGYDRVNDDILYKVLNKYNEIYNDHSTNLRKPYFGMIEVLDTLISKGYQLAVISNKPDQNTKHVVKHYFKDRFNYVVGAKKEVQRKPNSEAMQILLKELNLEIDDIYYVGDSHFDAEFAINSGCNYFLFTYGYESKDILYSYKPVAFLDSPSDLLKYL